MNKAFTRKQKVYSKLLKCARMNDFSLQQEISLRKSIAECDIARKLGEKYGEFLDYDNKEIFLDTWYSVPLYTIIKGVKVDLKLNRMIRIEKYESEFGDKL